MMRTTLLLMISILLSSILTNDIYAQTKPLDFTVAAKKSTPAVVHVISTCTTPSDQRSSSLIYDLFFNRQYSKKTSTSFGSGVIISRFGYIITNHHVIAEATKIQVVLSDKRMFDAVLIGTDPGTDLALLKIQALNLPCMKLGDSDKLQVGEWVLAVGNPFNLTSTVTAGIVSAKARDISILSDQEYSIESFIQTDAAVNKGNSGGALVNLAGELVGINSAILSPSGAYSGYSFAIPINLARKIMLDFIEFGVIQRGLLGVSIEEITSDAAAYLKLSKIEGVLISSVSRSGVAHKVGIKPNDVIIRIDNVKVNSTSELAEQMGQYRPGDMIVITLVRDDKQKVFKATLRNIKGGTKIIHHYELGTKAELNNLLDLIKQ